MSSKKKVYIEPADYFPKELRKKYGLGEYNKEVNDQIAKEFGLEPYDPDAEDKKKSRKTTKKKKKKW